VSTPSTVRSWVSSCSLAQSRPNHDGCARESCSWPNRESGHGLAFQSPGLIPGTRAILRDVLVLRGVRLVSIRRSRSGLMVLLRLILAALIESVRGARLKTKSPDIAVDDECDLCYCLEPHTSRFLRLASARIILPIPGHVPHETPLISQVTSPPDPLIQCSRLILIDMRTHAHRESEWTSESIRKATPHSASASSLLFRSRPSRAS
jgi:hypothetical protein